MCAHSGVNVIICVSEASAKKYSATRRYSTLRKDISDKPLLDQIFCLLDQFMPIFDRTMCMFDQFISKETDELWII